MNEPQINIDHFYHRPIYHVVGLLTEKSEISAISTDLASAGVDVAAVEILCGEQGAHILDEHGRYHGLRGRIVRAFQRLGYDETTLEIYDEALRNGDLLLQVPVRPADRHMWRGCFSTTMFTMWATSGPARLSSSLAPMPADLRWRPRPADPAADPARHWRPCLPAAPACCRHVPSGSRKRCGPVDDPADARRWVQSSRFRSSIAACLLLPGNLPRSSA